MIEDLRGFIQHKRNVSKGLFLVLRDNQKLLQITTKDLDLIRELDNLNKQSYIHCTAILNSQSNSILPDYNLIPYNLINQCETNTFPFALDLPNKIAKVDKSTSYDSRYFYLKN